MIYKGIGIFTALTLLSAAAHAGSAPKELYGKSFSVAWSESVTGTFAPEQTTRSFGSAYRMHVYVSTAGRPFVRVSQTGMDGGLNFKGAMSSVTGKTVERAPGQSSARGRVDFDGRSIVVYREFESGARRIAIDFEGANTICKANVVVGKQTGKEAVQLITGRGRFAASSVQVGTVSCSVREGNVFGQ